MSKLKALNRRMALGVVLGLGLWGVSIGVGMTGLSGLFLGRAVADNNFFGLPSAPYIAPDRLFSLNLPTDWTAVKGRKNQNFSSFMCSRSGVTVTLLVEHTAVSSGTNARQLVLRLIEANRKILEDYEILQKRDVDLFNGGKGAAVLANYAYQGNLQYMRTLEQLAIVVGNEAFILHFEAPSELFRYFSDDLQAIYDSFMPRPPALDASPLTPVPAEQSIEKIKF